MNHQEAMPENGTRFSAISTAARRPRIGSNVPAARGSAETESL